MARAAITAGLSAMIALGTSIPALATEVSANAKGATNTPVVGESANPEYTHQVTGESYGDTKLYIIGQQDDLTTGEGAADEQVKVSIPVAIHYVADSEGNLTGPSDNVVKFVNHTQTGPVHVSKILVDAGGSASDIALDDEGVNDRMSFNIQPVQGQSDAEGNTFVPATKFDTAGYAGSAAAKTAYNANATYGGEIASGNDGSTYVDGSVDHLGRYSNTESGEVTTGSTTPIDPAEPGAWNIVQKHGALGLNNLTGKIGGFGRINAGTDYQAGTIHWVVRSGTRAQADEKDCTLTIRYHANIGERTEGNGAMLEDQKVKILNYTASTPTSASSLSYDSTTANAAALKASSVVTAPKQVTNSDGTVTTYTFRGWSLDPNAGKQDNTSAIYETSANNFNVGAVVQNAKGNGAETDLSNGVVQLYAIYSDSTTTVA